MTTIAFDGLALQKEPLALRLAQKAAKSLEQDLPPKEVILISGELHNKQTRRCYIVLVLSKDGTLLGREENYDQCLFSQFRDEEHPVYVDRVRTCKHYLEIDRDVRSEMFIEFDLGPGTSFILNAELNTEIIPDSAKLWFDALCHVLKET